MSIKLYEINPNYINYLAKYESHIFHNKQSRQKNSRKYIGVVFNINNINYFAPLSSFKQKHYTIKESVDLIKIKNYAVININNMIPVPITECTYVDISQVSDVKYKKLLLAEYRVIKTLQNKIRKNANTVYSHKLKYGSSTLLGQRCNDFKLLESKYQNYK